MESINLETISCVITIVLAHRSTLQSNSSPHWWHRKATFAFTPWVGMMMTHPQAWGHRKVTPLLVSIHGCIDCFDTCLVISTVLTHTKSRQLLCICVQASFLSYGRSWTCRGIGMSPFASSSRVHHPSSRHATPTVPSCCSCHH